MPSFSLSSPSTFVFQTFALLGLLASLRKNLADFQGTIEQFEISNFIGLLTRIFEKAYSESTIFLPQIKLQNTY